MVQLAMACLTDKSLIRITPTRWGPIATGGFPADVAARVSVERAVGDGALRYADVLGLPVADEPRWPTGTALIGLAADRVRAGAPTEPLTPRYLRRPDVTPAAAPKPVSAGER